jgi:hypothetical protein
MEQQEMMFYVELSFSKEIGKLALADLEQCVTAFLERYGEGPMIRTLTGPGVSKQLLKVTPL